jgi:hypothetical protein
MHFILKNIIGRFFKIFLLFTKNFIQKTASYEQNLKLLFLAVYFLFFMTTLAATSYQYS